MLNKILNKILSVSISVSFAYSPTGVDSLVQPISQSTMSIKPVLQTTGGILSGRGFNNRYPAKCTATLFHR